MKMITATAVQNRFGQHLDECDRELVGISRNGRLKGVLMGIHEYNALKAIEAAYRAHLANSATDADFLGTEESEALIEALGLDGDLDNDVQTKFPRECGKGTSFT
jgi:PHD/YefM family antitoxin component YafN of YafNO toxin-antitoxin module